MDKKQNYFSIGSKLFWWLTLLVFIFVLLKLNPGIFNNDHIARDIIVEDSLSKINWDDNIVKQDTNKIDSVKNVKDSFICRTWKWKSFDNRTYTLEFKIKNNDYNQSVNCRMNANPGEEIWSVMYNNDKQGLKQMINGYKKIINDLNLNGMDALNMVVSSVQNFPYVLVTPNDCPSHAFGMDFANDCRPRRNSPGGCCGFVKPYGVYSPIEYAVNGSGDCDTKALFACTILKELDLGFYDAVMLYGDVAGDGQAMGAHAMLGISIINPPYKNHFVTDINRTEYYAWETTNPGLELGQFVWKTWRNWQIYQL